MNLTPLRKVLLVLCVGVASFGTVSIAEAATPAPAAVVPLGNNTYSITRTAKNGFHRDVDDLKTQAQQDAERFCASEGKQLKVVSLTTEKPRFSLGYANAKIVFKALAADDPELTAPIPVAGAAPVEHRPTDDLYSELTKLDDLRKKGILTDAEFQSEKTKVLNRSK